MANSANLLEPLRPTLPAAGVNVSKNGVQLEGVGDISIVSLAVPNDRSSEMRAALIKAYGIVLPDPGQSVVTPDGMRRCVWTTPEQFLLMFERKSDFPVNEVRDEIGDAAYLTDQSDAWSIFDLDGENSRAVLERICQLDLASEVFPPGAASCTAMKHIAAIVIRSCDNRFRLMAPSSYCGSFLHAVETSIANIS